MGVDPLQGLVDPDRGAVAVVVDDLQGDQVGAGGDAGMGRVLAADHAGDLGAVAAVWPGIERIGASRGEIVSADDMVSGAQAAAQRGVEIVDARVDHHDRLPLAGQSMKRGGAARQQRPRLERFQSSQSRRSPRCTACTSTHLNARDMKEPRASADLPGCIVWAKS